MPRRALRVSLRAEQLRLARVLALAMTVADLSGRVKVLDEAETETGRTFRGRRGLSFAEKKAFLAKAQRIAKFSESQPQSEVVPVLLAEGDAIVLAPEKLAPREALGFFRQRIAMTRKAFNRLQARYREVAFTVAKVESVAVIEQIQGVLEDVLESGQTQAVFARRVNELMKARGLSPLNPYHVETVFQTNINSAYNTGRASQMLQTDVRRALPYWRYLTVLDSRVREKHHALHGFLARFDDAVWKRIFPPNGFRCRCTVGAVTRARAAGLAGQGATPQRLDVAGSKRLPAVPDEGFDRSPVITFERRLERARRGLSDFREMVEWAA